MTRDAARELSLESSTLLIVDVNVQGRVTSGCAGSVYTMHNCSTVVFIAGTWPCRRLQGRSMPAIALLVLVSDG